MAAPPATTPRAPRPPEDRPPAIPTVGEPAASVATNEHHTMALEAPRGRRRREMRSRLVAVTLLAAMVCIYLAPRLVGLDRLVTVDEGLWLGRSANFYGAMRSGDFASTYQFAHPGVTTMWAGAIGFALVFPDYADVYPRQIKYVSDVHTVLRDLDHDPLALLVAGRTVKLVMQAAFMALAFWLARPVFGTPITVVGGLLIALDPFLIGHDRLLHVDSLFAVTAFVSLLALARYVSGGMAARYLVVSGVFAALAWLTRTPGVVLALVAGLVALGFGWRHWRDGAAPRQAAGVALRLLAVWGAAAAAVTFALWPALWVDPVLVARRMLGWSLGAASNGHEFASFFYGTVAEGDPSLFYYPVSLLWRLTPPTLLGLVVVGLGLAFRAWRVVPRGLVVPVALLAGYALLYGLGMSAGAKKFDRYILPVYPALDFVAAVGIVGLARLVRPPAGAGRRALAGAAVGLAVLGQLASALSTAPYYLPYFNPLLGGTAGAEEALLLGWGEGMDQVAGFILSQPGGARATVRGSNQRNTLLYFLPPSATVSPRGFPKGMEGVLAWAETDYYVAYVSQWQRETSVATAYLAAYPPVHTVSFGPTPFARTYDLNAVPPPAWMVDNSCAFTFGDGVQLVAHEDDAIERPGVNHRRLTLHFTSLPGAAERYLVRIDLLPRDPDLTPLTRKTTLRPADETGVLSEVDVQVRIPRKRTLRSYDLLVTVVDPATDQPIPATRVADGGDRPRALLPRCSSPLPGQPAPGERWPR